MIDKRLRTLQKKIFDFALYEFIRRHLINHFESYVVDAMLLEARKERETIRFSLRYIARKCIMEVTQVFTIIVD